MLSLAPLIWPEELRKVWCQNGLIEPDVVGNREQDQQNPNG